MDVDRRQLEHLLAVAEHRNLTRAAEALTITQPALSRSIQELERRLELRLFDRLSQGVVPTSACQVLLERARTLLAGFAELEHEAQRLGERYAGPLALGLGPAVAASGALGEVGRFVALHPALRCRLVIASAVELAARLRDHDVEFFVADQSPLDASTASWVMETLEYEAVLTCRAGHPALRADDPLSEVARYPLVAIGPPPAGLSALREFGRKYLSLGAADWSPVLTLDQAPGLAAVLLESDFVGVSAAYAHARELRAGALRVIPVPGSIYRGRVGPVRLRDRALSPAAEALWKLVTQTLRLELDAGKRPD